MRSYLSGRRQVFRTDSAVSGPCFVQTGVPQGSTVGPTYFSRLIIDGIDDCKVISFADDTTLLLSDPDPIALNRRATRVITAVNEWMHTNGLVLNASKTKLISFNKRSPAPEVFVHVPDCTHKPSCTCPQIEVVPYHKFLGLYVDSDLKYKHHVDQVCRKMRAGAAVLSKVARFVQPS